MISRFLLNYIVEQNQPMQQYNQSQQFSFYSIEASQGSNHQPYLKVKSNKPSKSMGNTAKCSQNTHTKTSSKNQKKKLAGIKSREKKKNYIKSLQQNVERLDSQIQQIDFQISRNKDNLVEALRTSNNNYNEHDFTFAELQKNAYSEDPNLDRINLLIDLIRNRIGADGKQRQAKIDYNFKQIINSMFPAIYRYLLNTADIQIDIFQPSTTTQSLINRNFWTYEAHQKAKLQRWQICKLNSLKTKLCESRKEAIEHATRLRMANQKIKKQGQFFEKRLGDFREDITPIQCAKMMLFAEKNKFRQQFTLCSDFEESFSGKKVKIQ